MPLNPNIGFLTANRLRFRCKLALGTVVERKGRNIGGLFREEMPVA